MTAVSSLLVSLLTAAGARAVLGFAVVPSRSTGDDAARSVARVALVAVVAAVAYVLDPTGARFAAAVVAGATAVVVVLGIVLVVWSISALAAASNRFLDKR